MDTEDLSLECLFRLLRTMSELSISAPSVQVKASPIHVTIPMNPRYMRSLFSHRDQLKLPSPRRKPASPHHSHVRDSRIDLPPHVPVDQDVTAVHTALEQPHKTLAAPGPERECDSRVPSNASHQPSHSVDQPEIGRVEIHEAIFQKCSRTHCTAEGLSPQLACRDDLVPFA